ncbi:MAG: LuxR C-terminal-related transcriptional regulator [Rubrobacteraceae bacterium]
MDVSESLVARVFVVAPTPMARAGLRSMLEAAEGSGVEVVGGAASLTTSDPSLAEADVVLVADEELLEDGAISSDDDPQAILVLSEDERVVSKLRALLPRGWGILPPDAPPEELEAAVVAVAHGLVVFPEPMTARLLGTPEDAGEPPEPLTAREGEVLGLIGRGLSNRMISRELHISEHTVKFHISSLYAKLEVGNRAEAVSRGARYGLISL